MEELEPAKPSSAIFMRDRRGRLKYSREDDDWGEVALPKPPSLRLSEDESFFDLIGREKKSKKRRNPFKDFVSRVTNLSKTEKRIAFSSDDCKVPTKRRTSVPLDVRKLEIELTQRRLPRYPSQNHLTDPTFYPLKSCDLFEWPPEPSPEDEEVHHVPETPNKKRVSFSIDEDNTTTSTTEVGTEYLDHELSDGGEEDEIIEIISDDDESSIEVEVEEEVIIEEDGSEASENDSYRDESYYSESSHSEDYVDDEVSMEAEDIFEEFLQLKRLQLRHVERKEPEPMEESFEESIIEESISIEMEESMSTIVDEIIEEEIEDEVQVVKSHAVDRSERISPWKPLRPTKPRAPTIGFSTKNLRPTTYSGEDDTYVREVGFVPPLVRMMVFQARMEMRSKVVPEEHKKELEPTLIEAIALARLTRLDECVIETQGQHNMKHNDAVIPSEIWVKGKETVTLPKFKDPTPEQFLIFNEAVALGGIKALKPEITTNYDQFASFTNPYENTFDVDDQNHHKYIRTKFLTDLYLQDNEWRDSDDDEDEESVHYETLDDVKLPTKKCPTFKVSKARYEGQELKDMIAQNVAERVWERRYRLERPRAKQNVTFRCSCKYCQTASPYQTFAYRKKWLLEQGLWRRVPVDEPVQPTNHAPVDVSVSKRTRYGQLAQ